MKRKKKRLKFTKKTKLLCLGIVLFSLIFTLVITFGRYVYQAYQNYILESKGFYFYSSVMTQAGSKHSIRNWDGVSAYPIMIDVNNKKNDLEYTTSDILYDISVECSSNIRCELSKAKGTIYQDVQTDSYTITVYPMVNFTSNQEAQVVTKATSTFPYVKELSTTYNIGIETSHFTYRIIDEPSSQFLTLELTNSFSYYKVVTPFLQYQKGDSISIDQYNKLTDVQKQNCMSANVVLSFDPNVILLDMTDNNYLNRLVNSEKTQQIGGYSYVNQFEFSMKASSSTKIIFYKTDSSKNYVYPGTDSIINVAVTSVNDISS